MWWRKMWKAQSCLLYCLTLLIILVSIFYLKASVFFPESMFPFIMHINGHWMWGPEFGLWNLRVLSCHWHLVYCLIFAWWDPGAVRRITTKICLRRHIELPKDVSVNSHAKSEVTTSETKSRAGTWTHDSLFQETDLRARAEVLSMIWWFSRVILLILLQNSLLFPSPIV